MNQHIIYEIDPNEFSADKKWREENLIATSYGSSYINGRCFIQLWVTSEEVTLISLARKVVPNYFMVR